MARKLCELSNRPRKGNLTKEELEVRQQHNFNVLYREIIEPDERLIEIVGPYHKEHDYKITKKLSFEEIIEAIILTSKELERNGQFVSDCINSFKPMVDDYFKYTGKTKEWLIRDCQLPLFLTHFNKKPKLKIDKRPLRVKNIKKIYDKSTKIIKYKEEKEYAKLAYESLPEGYESQIELLENWITGAKNILLYAFQYPFLNYLKADYYGATTDNLYSIYE